jgi:hypothetical protein
MKRLLVLSAVLLSSLAYAGTTLDTEAIQLSLASGNVSMQRQQIEAKLGQVEYTELTKENRTALNEQFALLVGESVPSDAAKAAEIRINSILKQTFADSKLVCTYEKPLGSNMKKRNCMTVAARKRSYDATQRTLQGQKGDSAHAPGG